MSGIKKKFRKSPTSRETEGEPEQTFVAWDVNNDSDTVGQSEHTTKIQGRTHSYTLDKVYQTDASTQDIYQQSVAPLVISAMEGYHSSVLAYGQTSTGKTFTMTGTKDSPGIVPHCIRDCFQYVEDSQQAREYLIRVTYLEVYKEHIRDLLAPTPQPVRLFDGPDGLIIKGIKEEVANSPEQVFAILKQGERRRQVAATKANQHSSRSHVMVRLWIESTDLQDENGNQQSSLSQHTRVSSLSLVDLAGSESVRLNGTERREEGQYINKSLMTLGQVVLALSEASKQSKGSSQHHIPYRDSKLTRLLQPSLSGNAQMVLLCCISPMATHLEESHNTFKFATRAKRIKQKATINIADSDEDTLLQNYRKEIQELKAQLAEALEHQRKLEREMLESQKQQQEQQQQQKKLEQEIQQQQQQQKEKHKSQKQRQQERQQQQIDIEIEELIEAISTMERLILKSRPHNENESFRKEKDLINLLAEEEEEEEEENSDELNLKDVLGPPVSSSFSTPSNLPSNGDDELTTELRRVRGLLGSVLQKRGVSTPAVIPATSSSSPGSSPNRKVERQLDFELSTTKATSPNSTPPRNGDTQQQEVKTLRKQLKKQQLATSLRKADSSFLQKQLQEKDALLEEVSKILEAVEQRQSELEAENAVLRAELADLKKR